MVRIAVKGVLARKLRTLLTSIAIILGVGFVAGAFILTDTMRGSFSTLFDEATKSTDVQVITKVAEKQLKALQSNPSAVVDHAKVGIDASVVPRIAKVDGVRHVEGSVFEIGFQPLDKHGKLLGGHGAPTFGAGWPGAKQSSGPLHITRGRAPRSGEALLDDFTADKGHYKVGDTLGILLVGGKTETRRISGIVKFGESASLNGASIVAVPMAEAQQVLGFGNRYTAIDAQGQAGVDPATLKRRVQKELGKQYVVKTGAEVSAEEQESINKGFLNILQDVILAFAAVSVFVGAFTIFNTFTITVGQRTREFGLLRAVGASRSQVLGIVLLEALVTGVVASTVGIAVGYGVAALLRALLTTFGAEINGSFELRARTIFVSYLVGIVVTVVASIVPALRASRLSPLEAMRASSTRRSERAWIPLLGGALLVVGAGLIAFGLLQGSGAKASHVLLLLAIGSGIVLLGLALVSRLLIAPMVAVIGPLLTFGISGSLARRNINRSRARAAATSAALMIGLALSCLAITFYSSLGATIDHQIDQTIGADVSVYNQQQEQTGQGVVSDRTLAKIRATKGVRYAEGIRQSVAVRGKAYDLSKKTAPVAAAEKRTFTTEHLIKAKATHGSLDDFARGTVIVSSKEAKARHLKVGDHAHFAFPSGPSRSLKVVAIFKGTSFDPPYVIDTRDFDAGFPPSVRGSAFVYVKVDQGVSPKVVTKRIGKAVGNEKKFLVIEDSEGLRKQFRSQLTPVLGMVLAMLALSLVIALFGIANTLALNVFERTREIGLLRAVGSSRRLVRRMVRGESVLVALFGSVIGAVAGIIFAAAIISSLKDQGFVFKLSPFVIGVLLVGFLAGIVAAILPARRAARMDVLRAITHD
jgi:putative ABC transport system permease protein